MSTAVQRYLSKLFKLETDKSRNDKLLSLSLRDASRIHDHIIESKRWIASKHKGLCRNFYNPELDVEFRITYSSRPDNEGKYQAAMIYSTRDKLNNDPLDLITFSWDSEVAC